MDPDAARCHTITGMESRLFVSSAPRFIRQIVTRRSGLWEMRSMSCRVPLDARRRWDVWVKSVRLWGAVEGGIVREVGQWAGECGSTAVWRRVVHRLAVLIPTASCARKQRCRDR